MITPFLCIETRSRYFYLPAVLTIAFLCAFGATGNCFRRIRDFETTLQGDQLSVYQEISRERRNIFYRSIFVGLLFVIIYILFSSLARQGGSLYHLCWDTLCILCASIYLFYTISFKKKHMLSDVNLSTEEVRKWYAIYRCMEENFWRSFIVGLLASGAFLVIIDCILPPTTICATAVQTRAVKTRERQGTQRKKKRLRK